MRRSLLLSAVIWLSAAALSGCGAGWHETSIDGRGALAAGQQAQVWVHEVGPVQLVKVRWTPDSVYGLPNLAGLDGDSAQVAFARSEVDSVRTGNPSAGFWKTTGLVVLGALVSAVAACALSSTCEPGD